MYFQFVHLQLDVDECSQGTNHCHQKCVNINGSYTCACREGHNLNSDGYSCTGKELLCEIMTTWEYMIVIPDADIDECTEGIDRCEQNCHNSIGSYACSCFSGFRLDRNGVACNGNQL